MPGDDDRKRPGEAGSYRQFLRIGHRFDGLVCVFDQGAAALAKDGLQARFLIDVSRTFGVDNAMSWRTRGNRSVRSPCATRPSWTCFTGGAFDEAQTLQVLKNGIDATFLPPEGRARLWEAARREIERQGRRAPA